MLFLGSYMRKLDKHASSAGFVILCLHTGKVCTGALTERSTSASNYRREALGAVVVQLVLHAATARPSPFYSKVFVHCNNRCILTHSNSPTESLPNKQEHANILRYPKNLVSKSPLEIEFI